MPRPSRCVLVAAALLAAAPASAEIVVATAGPMSGPFEIFGAQMMAGAEQAIADINAAGGLLGETLVLEVADDRCDRKEAEPLANRMVGRRAVLMVGHLCSGASILASPVYNDAGIIQISPGARAPQYTDERPGPGVFRLAGRDDSQGMVAGTYLAEHFHDRRIAIVHDNSPYGSGLAEATRDAMNAAGKQEAFYDDYTPNETDYGSLLARLDAGNIDIVFIGGSYTDIATIASQMHDEGLSTRLVSGDALLTQAFIDAAGTAGNGTLVTYPPDPTRNPAAQPVMARLEARSIPADGYVLPAYAAVEIWAEAVKRAGTFDFAPVAEAVAAGTFDTVLGSLTFDAKGDASLPDFVVYEWHDDEYRYAPM